MQGSMRAVGISHAACRLWAGRNLYSCRTPPPARSCRMDSQVNKRYSCRCGVAFTSERSLNFHRGSRACRLRDPTMVRFTCPDCKFTAYYQKTLEKHRQIRHSSKNPFECKCGEKYSQLSELLEHQRNTPCKSLHTCKICGHISPTQGQLNRHYRSHSEEKPFVCECGRAYPRKDSYYRHQRTCKASQSKKSAEASTPALSSAHASQISTDLTVPSAITQTSSDAAQPVTSLPVPELALSNSKSAQSSGSSRTPVPARCPRTPPQQAASMPSLPSLVKPILPPPTVYSGPPNGLPYPAPGQNSHHQVYPPQPTHIHVHAPIFVPYPVQAQTYANMTAPPPSDRMGQLMNLSYLAAMSPPIDSLPPLHRQE